MHYPYAEVEFESTGAVHDPSQRQAAIDLVTSSTATDVLVLAHGWNNDMPAARRLFEQLTDSVADAQQRVPGAATRSIVVLGLLWPSVKWADEDDLAGGGAGVADEQAGLQAAIDERIDDPAVAAELARLVPDLETSAAAREQFLDLLRRHMPDADPGDEDPPPAALVDGEPQAVFDEASGPDVDFGDGELSGGGAAGVGGIADADAVGVSDGGAAGFGFGGILRGARNLLNLTTYYTMKDRAGKVGSNGVAQLLDAVAAAAPDARIHLAGHSFGARVVAAAAAAHPDVHAIMLLQGAFSHHGFAADYNGKGQDGFFRSVLESRRLAGPLVVTHTGNDKAVGVAYAIASRLARQAASGLGGANDLYGGIGRNGALKTPEVGPGGDLLEVGQPYRFEAGRVYNLQSDRFISSHSAVTGPEAGYALLSAMIS